jgi:hypothetical protein
MSGLTLGFWEIADQSLQWIGRSAAWHLARRRFTRDESVLCAAAGGALACAVFGGVVGFSLADFSLNNIGAIGGTILGGMLGICIGFIFGASVETVSSTIKNLLMSLDSK